MSEKHSKTARRLGVHRTYKAYLNGSFVRSESGRTYKVVAKSGPVDVVDGSRKDARDAVRSGREAASKWSGSSPYLRGQIMYRFAEMLEASTFLDDLSSDLKLPSGSCRAAADLAVHYAGFADKLGQILGSTNAIAGHSSSTEPLGLGLCVVSLPSGASLLDMVEPALAALAAQNSVILTADGPAGVLMCALAERIAVSDVPAGLWQVLPSSRFETISALAAATDVRALDVQSHPRRHELEDLAAESLTKIRQTARGGTKPYSSLENIRWQMDYRTIVGPVGK